MTVQQVTEHNTLQPSPVTRASGAQVYDGTVFLSYARADDEPPPNDPTTRGWVTYFWQHLRWAISDEGVSQAKLWRDRYEIEPAERFTDKIEAALRESSLLVPVLSRNWVTREWCLKELARFEELRPEDADKRVVLIKKSDPPEDAIPELLRNREGYKFFVKDPTGDIQYFYWQGLEDKKAYFDLIRKIARWIAEQLISRTDRGPDPKPDLAPQRRAIFVAAPADELRDAWQRLVNDLEKSGFAVTPAEGRLPDSASRAEAEIRAGLANAEMSVHFLGESEGVKPERSADGIVRLQLRLAREHALASTAFRRVLWAPKWTPEHRDKKRDPFEVIARFGDLQPNEEIYAEEVTDLSQWLRDKLTPRAPATATLPSLPEIWVAGTAAPDDDLIGGLANFVQACGLRVQPIFAGDPAPTTKLPGGALSLVLWNSAELAAIDAALSAVRAQTDRVVVLRLPGGDERAKARFFRTGVTVERIDAVPADRAATRKLLARLEILPLAAGEQP